MNLAGRVHEVPNVRMVGICVRETTLQCRALFGERPLESPCTPGYATIIVLSLDIGRADTVTHSLRL